MNENKKFLKLVSKIAIPIVLQNFLLSMLNMVDIIVIGGMGEKAIAAVGIANNDYFFLLNLILFGVCSGTGVFTSQYWGKKDIGIIKLFLGMCLTITISAAIVFTILGMIIPNQIISVFNRDPEVIKLGASFLSIVSLSYIPTAISFSYSFTLKSMGKVKLTLLASFIGLSTNTILNFMLVYGMFFFPKLGVRGSAIATIIARLVEMSIMVGAVYLRKGELSGKIADLFKYNKQLVKRYLNTATPIILNEMVWALGVLAYAIVYGFMGYEVVAAMNVFGTIDRFAWVGFMGLGTACSVIIGNSIGDGNSHKVHDYARKFIKLTFLTYIVFATLVYFLGPIAISLYNLSPEVDAYVRLVIKFYCIVLFFKSINFMIIVGILRSGGDTKFAFLADVGSLWFVGVPLAILGYKLGWTVPYVFLILSCEEVVKFILGMNRVRSKKWVNNLTI